MPGIFGQQPPQFIVVNSRRFLRPCAVLVGVLLSGPASAQMAAQVGVASENDYRGNSLSDGKPVATLSIALDDPGGWFAGGLLGEARFRDYSHDVPQLVVDAGYAHALSSGLSWEAGVTASLFPGAASNNYGELFAGVASRRWSARVYVSSDYYGRGYRTIYSEFNYFHPLNDRLRLLGHVGALHVENIPGHARSNTFDTRVGIDWRLGDYSLQLQHVDTNRESYAWPVGGTSSEHRWFVSVTHPW